MTFIINNNITVMEPYNVKYRISKVYVEKNELGVGRSYVCSVLNNDKKMSVPLTLGPFTSPNRFQNIDHEVTHL